MSLYNVPFTSKLEMWSPSPSVTMNYYNHNNNNFNNTAITVTEPSSRFFHHHEVLLYPSACIVCGLPHHPAPHTVMEYQTPSPAITTPAPTESYLQPTLTTNIIKRSSSRSYKRHVKPHKKISLQFKYMTRKFIRILALVIKAPLNRHSSSIYPVKRDRAD